LTLVACGGDTATEVGDESSAAATEAAAQESAATDEAPADDVASAETEINVLCFQGYTEPDWVTPFEEQYGVKVNMTYAGTVEEMFTKAMAGGTAYDVVSIDCGSLKRYYDAGILQPIDQNKITNFGKLSQFFQDADYKMIDGAMYHVPMCWGSNNVVYNKDALPGFPQTWSVLWDPAYKGQVSVTDEANNNVVTAAISLGFEDPYNLTDGQFEQVKERLIEIVKNCRTFSNGYDNEFQLLSTGETNASISGYDSGLVMRLRDEADMNVGRLMPEEGVYAWIDGWVMLKDAEHPETAQKWMDWMLTDESQKALAKMMSFGAVTPAAKDALDPDVVALCSYDDIDKITVPVFIMKTPEDFEKRVEIWNEAKASQ
jgi:putative spermidine/putrescine transport system substrate-binding protein/spermidine/putrescine transport system substrate-binding protein